ncbi:class I SAM-dependent methyltransferase [Novosphingobium kaempferiae]|uniref:class I SAM-dependent methyltransferase n=1 Tax=Novosphingobium kaempferiae TaxID=2896849 RepID=UPI001E5EB02A|nr:class I SAM-dependent methyltransferase [Novosphingobium kaempferiae]
MDLKEEDILGERIEDHWYYRAKLKAVLHDLDSIPFESVLDVGAGSGFFSRRILAATQAREATCVDPNYPAETEETVAGKALRFRRSVEATPADLVLMMDVIEHVPDDVALVREYAAQAASGTHFLVTVPAFMWLWSGHDVFLEHYRRYTLPGLAGVLGKAGLEMVHGHYFFGAVLPMVAAVRGWKRLTEKGKPATSDMKPVSRPINDALFGLSALEVSLMRLNRLGGTSVFALARKA